jgi:NAD(P)-dependent dehydrogenase (short-subunit alcohol dehydrogenase family)
MSHGFDVKGAVALVTGANRGIGAAFVRGLLDAGAAKVYAAARNPETVDADGDARIVPVRLDVTDAASVAEAAERLKDVTLLVNNAGIAHGMRLIGAPSMDSARAEMEVNYFGTLAVTRAFAPVLAAGGGGAIVNVLSIVSRVNMPLLGSYSASKAAAYSLTQGIRAELAAQRTRVLGVMPGFVDTDMAARVASPKIPAAEVVAEAVRALAEGEDEVYPGAQAAEVAAALAADPRAVERQLAAALAPA